MGSFCGIHIAVFKDYNWNRYNERDNTGRDTDTQLMQSEHGHLKPIYCMNYELYDIPKE